MYVCETDGSTLKQPVMNISNKIPLDQIIPGKKSQNQNIP